MIDFKKYMAKTTKGSPPPQGTAPAAEYDWSQAGASGFEHVGKEDLGIPFLVILQKGSPQIDEANPEHAQKGIEDAKVGDIINSLSNAIVYSRGGQGLPFIPCSFEKLFVEWTPREKGGGIIKAHRNATVLNECTRNERGQDVLRNGNLVVTTAYFYGLMLSDAGESTPCVIGMSSSQLKKSRQWLNMMMALKLTGPNGKYTPPMFSHTYGLSTIPESNEKGNWFGWKIDMVGRVTDQKLIGEAVATSRLAAAGQRTALPASTDDVPEDKM